MKFSPLTVSLTLLAPAMVMGSLTNNEFCATPTFYPVLEFFDDKGDSYYDRTNNGKAIALGCIFAGLVFGIGRSIPSARDVLFKQAVFGQASVLALGPESEANVHKIEENFFDLMDFSLATIPEVGRDEGEPISAKSDSGTGRANDGKAIAIGMIFESLLVAMSSSQRAAPLDMLVEFAVYGQASVLALGPESEANVHKIQEIYDVLIDFAMCATGVDDSACDALPDRDPSFSLVDSGIGTNSSSYDQVNAGKAIALGMLDFSIPLSKKPNLSNYIIPTSAYGRASVLALGPESEANIDKAMEVYLELIESYALEFESL